MSSDFQSEPVSNWGNYPRRVAKVAEVWQPEMLPDHLATSPVIGRGNGRSYGDASLAENILSTRHFGNIRNFDPEAQTIEVESGVRLEQVASYLLPRGFILPVTPGTKLASVGGAIAADVHGKNHIHQGSWSSWIKSFELITGSGETLTITPAEQPELFAATLGGMGLTGIVTKVTLKLLPVETAWMRQESFEASSLAGLFELFDVQHNAPYQVAWINSISRETKYLLTTAHPASVDELPKGAQANPLVQPSYPRKTVPFYLPGMVLNKTSMGIYNRRHLRKNKPKGPEIVDLDTYHYPLDRLLHWNRIYGRSGFIQYQIGLPDATALEGLTSLLDQIHKSRFTSFLTVLKKMGKGLDGPTISFPMAGYSLALDFKYHRDLPAFLQSLDKQVATWGGRVYLAKDSCLLPEDFAAMYPHADAFAKVAATVNPDVFRSDLSERVGLSAMIRQYC